MKVLSFIIVLIFICFACHTSPKKLNQTLKRFDDTTLTDELKIKLDSVIIHSDDVIKYEENSEKGEKISYYVCKIPAKWSNKATYQATLTFDTLTPGWSWYSKIFIDSSSLKVTGRSVN